MGNWDDVGLQIYEDVWDNVGSGFLGFVLIGITSK